MLAVAVTFVLFDSSKYVAVIVSPSATCSWFVSEFPPTRVRAPLNNPGCVVSNSVTVVRFVRELVTKLTCAWPVPAKSESPTSTNSTSLVV